MDGDDQPGGSTDLTAFNLIAAALLTGFGLICMLVVIPGHVPASSGIDQGLSARFMPYLAAASFTVLSAMLGLAVLYRKLRGLGAIREDNEDNDRQGFGPRECLNAGILLLSSAAYVWLLSIAGFVLASALALFLCLFAAGVRNWALLIAVGAGIPFFISHALWWGLKIAVPKSAFLPWI